MHRKEQDMVAQLSSREENFPYEIIFNAFPDLIFVLSSDGFIINYKAGTNAPLYLPPEEFIEKRVQDVLPEEVSSLFTVALNELNATGKPTSFEYSLNIDGIDYWYEARLLPDNNEQVIVIVRDVSSKKEVEIMKDELISLLKTIYNNSSQFTGLLKADGTLLHANKFALDFGGISEEQVLNRPLWDSYWWQVSPDTQSKLKNAIKEAAKDVFINFEAEVQGKNKQKAILEFSLKPVKNNKGDVIFLIPEGREITEKKVAEMQLRESEYIYRSFAENIPGGGMSVFDKDLRLSLVGGPALDALGLPKEIIEGKLLKELVPREVYRRLAPYYKNALLGKTMQFEFLGHNKRWYLCTVAPFVTNNKVIENGFAVYSDIQHQKEIEKELKQKVKELHDSQTLFKALIANFPYTLIFTYNMDMEFIYAGGEVMEANGFIKEELIGKSVYEVLPDYEANDLLRAFQAALIGKASNLIRLFPKTGHHYSTTIAPIYDDNGNILGGIAVAFDIEKLKRTEQELEQKIQELSQLNDKLNQEIKIKKFIETNLKNQSAELKRKNQELEQFAYVASHDLQEPLRMVSSFTQLLSKRYFNKLDSTANEFIGFAVEGAQRMQVLINDLLSYSRIGTNAKPFKIVDVKQVMKNALNNLSVRIEETGANITLGQMPETINGDETQLTQLFQNLISNALKFKKENTTPEVFINTADFHDHILFYVQDNGIGIAMEHKERIFQIFQRLHTRDKYPGTGIGLAICKKIVERHNGEIWVESEKEMGGTRFYFTIKKQQA